MMFLFVCAQSLTNETSFWGQTKKCKSRTENHWRKWCFDQKVVLKSSETWFRPRPPGSSPLWMFCKFELSDSDTILSLSLSVLLFLFLTLVSLLLSLRALLLLFSPFSHFHLIISLECSLRSPHSSLSALNLSFSNAPPPSPPLLSLSLARSPALTLHLLLSSLCTVKNTAGISHVKNQRQRQIKPCFYIWTKYPFFT